MSYDALVLLAALASLRLAEGLSSDQLEVLAAFFEVLGDNLSLLALRSASGEGSACTTPPNG